MLEFEELNLKQEDKQEGNCPKRLQKPVYCSFASCRVEL